MPWRVGCHDTEPIVDGAFVCPSNKEGTDCRHVIRCIRPGVKSITVIFDFFPRNVTKP